MKRKELLHKGTTEFHGQNCVTTKKATHRHTHESTSRIKAVYGDGNDTKVKCITSFIII